MMKPEYISKFKKMLTERAVSFQYYKKDGTLRTANGTMKADLLPKTEPTWKFDVFDIKWKDRNDLPKKTRITVTQKDIDEWGVDAMDNVVITVLEKKFGGTIDEFEYYELDEYDKREFPEDSIFYYDLDKKAFRSFKADKLFSVALAEGDNW